MTIFIISIVMFIVSILILIRYKIKKLDPTDSIVGNLSIAGIVVSVIIGFIIYPLAVELKVEEHLIEDYEVIRGTHTLILDFQINGEDKIKAYDDHKSYVEIGDSTRFYLINHKAFYGNNVRYSVIWRNPPYDKNDIQ
jgi:hypothetical protein